MTWKFWRWSLAAKILAGLVVGAILGVIASETTSEPESLRAFAKDIIQPIGNIFLRLIFMMVIPLIVSAIILGISEMGDVRKLGRVGFKSLLVTVILSAIGVLIGLAVVNTLKPGKFMPEEKRLALIAQYGADAQGKVVQGTQEVPLSETLLNLIPANPLAEAVNAFTPNYTGGGLLSVMVFSLIIGVALTVCDPEKVRILNEFFKGLFEVSMVIIGFAMKLAPVCVGCLGFVLTATLGLEIIRTLGFYVLTVVLGLGLHMFVTYSLTVKFFGGRSPVAFFRESREALFMAFGSSSSNATLPVSMRVAEQNLKVPSQISRFVMTVGASANQNGTALYEGVTVLFLAQVFGVDLTFTQQLTVALMCILAGVGTAGVPGGSLPLVVGVLVTIGVPGSSIAIILGIDRLLDMCRTTLNVAGDLVIAVVVAKGEKEEEPALEAGT